MSAIPASLVMSLRRSTGAGMMDCKKALASAGADAEAATDWLRARGLSKAAGKTSAAAAEGLVAVLSDGDKAVVVEVNTQTDFAARSETFQKAVRDIAALALKTSGDVDQLRQAPAPNGSGSVSDMLTGLIATIGENIHLRRIARLACDNGICAHYVHAPVCGGLGRIGAVVALRAEGEVKPELAAVARKIAMHVAAANPVSASRSDIDPELVARERAVIAEQARQSGKPENIIEKMVSGRLNKYFQESVLLEQTFVMDADTTVEKFIATESAAIGCPASLGGFAMLRVGEGVETTETDFAEEVAATTR